MTSIDLRLDHLYLRNYRCFPECTIHLNEKLTVLVAENGQGKTAILDAIGIALGTFVDAITDSHQSRGFERTDVHMIRKENDSMSPVLPTEFWARGHVAGNPIEWGRELRKYSLRARSTTKDVKALRSGAYELRATLNIAEGPTTLPLVAFYGTGRLWSEHRLTEGKRKYAVDSSQRLSAYTDCLSRSSSFKDVAAWYEEKMREFGDSRFKLEYAENMPLVRAVQEAVRVALNPTGWADLNWSHDQRSLVAEHPTYGRLLLSALSDGIRNMIALVADIAHKCARLNPHLGERAAQETPGVLLIDEIDMHLHPRWQQLVVGLLQEAFPALQMVLSTHSPHVLSAVNVNSIRVVRLSDGLGSVSVPTLQTQGMESTDILSEVMDVKSVPPVEQADWLSDYRALVQTSNEDSLAAKNLWNKLLEHFGEGHPIMVEVEVLRRLQEFRRANHVPPERGN